MIERNGGTNAAHVCGEGCRTFPLSAVQRSMWLTEQLDPGTVANHVGGTCILRGPLEARMLGRIGELLGTLQPMCTATFSEVDGVPAQTVHGSTAVPIRFVDGSGFDDEAVVRWVREVFEEPFDLAHGPLAHIAILSVDDDTHVLVQMFHHLISDLRSHLVVLRLIADAYEWVAGGESGPAPVGPRSTFDRLVADERNLIEGDAGDEHLRYWRKQLAGATPTLLTTRRRPPLTRTGRGARIIRTLDPMTSEQVLALAHELRTTPLSIALSSLQLLIGRLAGTDDVTVGTLKFNRSIGTARTVGCYMRPAALRSDLAGCSTFADVVGRVTHALEGMALHDAYPVQQLVERLHPASQGGGRFFQVVGSWQKAGSGDLGALFAALVSGTPGQQVDLGPWIAESTAITPQVAPYDLTLLVTDERPHVVMTFEYSTDVFTEDEIVGLADQYVRLVEAVAADHDVLVADLPLPASPAVDVGRSGRVVGAGRCGGGEVSTGDGADSDLVDRIAAIWQDVLGVTVTPTDDFFEVGGHSLLATQIVSRVRSVLHREVPVRALFEWSTVGAFAAFVATAPATSDPAPTHRTEPIAVPSPGGAVTRDGAADGEHATGRLLSSSQERMWFVHQVDPLGAAYNLAGAVRMTGRLDEDALAQAVVQLVARHDSLRTRFVSRDGEVRQIVEPDAPVAIDRIDLRGVSVADRARRLEEEMSREIAAPFDLGVLPLMRVALLRTDHDEVVLVVVMHHIVSDQWSFGILSAELAEIYNARVTGRNPDLVAMEDRYSRYSDDQRLRLSSEHIERELGYWRGRLSGLKPLELATDHPRPLLATSHGDSVQIRLSSEFVSGLQAYAAERRASPFMVLLAGLMALLRRSTSDDDIAVGTPVANRNRTESEGLITTLVNTLILRVATGLDATFDELVERVRTTALDAYEHQDMPFDLLVQALRPRRDPSRSPLFQVFFNVLNAPVELPRLEGLDVAMQDVHRRGAQFDLSFSVDTTVEWVARLEYNADLFDHRRMERMLGDYQRLLAAAIDRPRTTVAELEFMSAQERAAFGEEWAATAVDVSEPLTIHERFEAQARRTPERTAVRHDDRVLTYADLDARSNQLAAHLRHMGVGAGDLVGVHLERSEAIAVAVLGVLKAGAAYVPLDPGFPQDRLAFMIEDSGLEVVVSMSGLTPISPASRLVLLDTDLAAIEACAPTSPGRTAGGRDLAYVIYTSGSTGRPKGVQLEHRSVVNFLASMAKRPGLHVDDVLVSVTTLSFDISVLEIFGPLMVGATVVVVGRLDAIDGRVLARIIESSGATVVQATPITWRLLLDAGWSAGAGFRALCGGEAMPRELADALLGACSEVWNMYGPTETTVWSAVQRVMAGTGPVPIGTAIDNTQLYVVDGRGRPVSVGVPGELCIGGAGVARGYLHRAELTAERFDRDPFGLAPDDRMYRTGDLVRRTVSGELAFVGRMDQQVKVRGYRIELGEIESVLAQHPSVAEVAVVTQDFGDGDVRLVAHVVASAGESIDSAVLRQHARQRLPEYMVPAAVSVLESLPLTPNNKVDRNALPRVERASADRVARRPRAGLEQEIASIWSKVLGVRDVGGDDDFFELGGHSLLAVRAFAYIERLVGRQLPLTMLFEAPTLAGLTALIEGSASVPARWTSLVPIQPGGTKQAFYHVSPFMISVLSFANLARHLGPDQPLYGLQPQGMDGVGNVHTTIEAMASHYIDEMRDVQPTGPYALGGHCSGSTVAFEMARQLQAAGEVVDMLLIVDAEPPGFTAPGPRWRDRIERLRYYRRERRLLHAVRWRANVAVQHILVRRLGGGESRRVAELRAIHAAAHRRYRPTGKVVGDALLIRSADMASLAGEAWHLRWADLLTGQLEVAVIPGTHDELVEDIASGAIAEQIRTALMGLQR